MTRDKLAFVSFEPSEGQFRAFLSMEGLFSTENDPELVLREAARLYERSMKSILSSIAEIRACRTNRKLVPARKIWQVGDGIFELSNELAKLGLQLNDLYGHLVRDLGAKRKWLEKAVIFRRYLPVEAAIPKSLNWGRCEKGTRRKAEHLANGLPVN